MIVLAIDLTVLDEVAKYGGRAALDHLAESTNKILFTDDFE